MTAWAQQRLHSRTRAALTALVNALLAITGIIKSVAVIEDIVATRYAQHARKSLQHTRGWRARYI